MRRQCRRSAILFLAGVIGLAVLAGLGAELPGGPGPALAGEAAASSESTAPPPQDGRVTLWSLIGAGGWIGFVILALSVAAIALVVEHFLTIRRLTVAPPELEARLKPLLEGKDYRGAQALCRQDGSFLAQVVDAGLAQVGGMFGFFDMQASMQEVSERQAARLTRKLEYLAFIANSAPMLGLLGTVVGMIRAFNEIALAGGAADPADLADGISQALVTTCMGLVVAIPTLFFVSLFRNRIDAYVAEVETSVERLFARFRSGSR